MCMSNDNLSSLYFLYYMYNIYGEKYNCNNVENMFILRYEKEANKNMIKDISNFKSFLDENTNFFGLCL